MPAFPWRRLRIRRNDFGSMPVAMLVTLVGMSLSATLSGMVIGQIKTSARAADRATALVNAQAGLDFALNRVRMAVKPSGAGDLTGLPCDWTDPRYAPAAGARYSVSMGYYLNDPTNLAQVLGTTDPNFINIGNNATAALSAVQGLVNSASSGLVGQLTTVANGAIKCAGGVLSDIPLFGLIKATGTAGPGGATRRTLYATYVFHNADDYISGGPIVIAGTGGVYCMGDASGTPTAGDYVVAIPCTSAPAQLQFIYPKNLNLALYYSRSSSSSTGPTYPYGLCITAATPPTDGANATFQPCKGSSVRDASQMYDYEVNAQTYWGATPTLGNSGYCLNVSGTVSTGAKIVMKTGGNCGSAGVTGKAFVPDEKVGPGGAGTTSGQYVNDGEEGRCLDLTNEDPAATALKNAGKPVALISYPCKQTFTGDVYWNHKWFGPLTPALINQGVTSANGLVYVIKPASGATPAQSWCMKSPGAAGGFVWVALCNPLDSAQQWTVNGATGATATSYQVTDGNGLCLESAVGLGSSYIFSSSGTLSISYVVTAPCTGSNYQKWNAPTDIPAGPLKGIQEK